MEEIRKEIEKLNSRLDFIEEALRLLLVRETIADIQSKTGISSESAKQSAKYIGKKDISVNDKVKIKSGSLNYFGGILEDEVFDEEWLVSKIDRQKVTLKDSYGKSLIVKLESLESYEEDETETTAEKNTGIADVNMIKGINKNIKKIKKQINSQKRDIKFLCDEVMLNKLKGILSEELEVSSDIIHDCDYLIDDLAIDEIDTSDLVKTVEREFNVKLSDSFFEKDMTVKELYMYIKQNRKEDKSNTSENIQNSKEYESNTSKDIQNESADYCISNDMCILCGACQDACPVGAIEEYVITDSCISCGICVNECPVSAIYETK